MRRIIFSIFIAILVIWGIVGSLYMMKIKSNKDKNEEFQRIEIADKVTDECIEENDELEIAKEEIEETSSHEEEKVSPNAVIEFEKFYNDCEHTINRYEVISDNLVNATKAEIEQKYNTWILKEFTKDKIVLYREEAGQCGEHYVLRNVDGKINIYKLDESGNEELLEKTEIATEYLTETDMMNMENGLIVYGKENLNQLLEDFE